MKFYNINSSNQFVSFKEAVLTGIQGSEGLYMPAQIPQLPESFFNALPHLTLQEIAYQVSLSMLGDDMPVAVLQRIANSVCTFPIPLVNLSEQISVLELFHGPTLAFKDVGARFMAAVFEYLMEGENNPTRILVATSGDTGGAVANAFHNRKGIEVTILFPKGMVSPLQELQLTTLGGNVEAVEVDGTFDDCQRMVKSAFADASLHDKVRLASANSINFARLFPQSFYYFYAMAQLPKQKGKVAISVPSGNFGNLTAGLLAKLMGLAVDTFIAATNANCSVTNYFTSGGSFKPMPTVATISNAMDVGNPSNFPRMTELYTSNFSRLSNDVQSFSFSDEATKTCMRKVYNESQYILDPHGAVGYMGVTNWLKNNPYGHGVFLETAHPSKFKEVVESVLNKEVEVPESLLALRSKSGHKNSMSANYELLRDYLLSK